MDTLTPIVALVGGLYDMVPWREVLIGVGIVVWLWAGLQKSYVLGRSLDELKANLHRLEDKLDNLGASKAQQDYPNGSAMTDDLDHVEEKIERAGSETLNRMALLVQKGYKPSFSEPMDAIWLHHPRYSFKHKLVILYGDGTIITGDGADKHRIGRDEKKKFDKFLRTVPGPTLWESKEFGAWAFLYSASFGGVITFYVVWKITASLLR